METINDLTNFFGYYLSNLEFQKFISENLIKPTKYNSEFQYISCKSSKLELCFTNERMIRIEDGEKSLIGGKPIFTHFFIYQKTEILFKNLPFNLTFKDSLESIEIKAGKPHKLIETNMFLVGNIKNYHYTNEKNEIIVSFDNEKEKIKQILIQQIEKEIMESSKPQLLEVLLKKHS